MTRRPLKVRLSRTWVEPSGSTMTSLTTGFSPLPRPNASPAAAERDCAAAIPAARSGEGDDAPNAVTPCPLARTTAKKADETSLGNMNGPQRGSKTNRERMASHPLMSNRCATPYDVDVVPPYDVDAFPP